MVEEKLSPKQLQAEKKIGEWLRKGRDDFSYFLFNFAKTLDTHDKEMPIKSFPDFTYLQILAEKFPTERKILIVKSRQMMITWLCTAYCLWDTLWHQGRFWFIVSKKEEDANELVDRVKFIFYHLPRFVKDFVKIKDVYCKLEFIDNHSKVWGVSQDASALRTYTASGIFSDELAFQPYAEKSYAAYKPTLDKQGQFIGVSTPDVKNFFYRLLYDEMKNESSN